MFLRVFDEACFTNHTNKPQIIYADSCFLIVLEKKVKLNSRDTEILNILEL